MIKKIILLALLLIPALTGRAQSYVEVAEKAYKFLKAGQGDSLLIMSDSIVQARISANEYGMLYTQLEIQLGEFKFDGEWEVKPHEDSFICKKMMQFENMKLIFSLTLNKDNQISGLYFLPDMRAAQTYTLITNDTIKEETIDIITDDYKLGGILTLPVGISNPPVAILVHGSGSSDRDETVGPNKPFRDLAWGLAERGVAVIRYDKRSYIYGNDYAPEGKGNIDYEAVYDALSAIRIAKKHPELSGSKIFVIGHSLGALVAPRIADSSSDLSGIVMIAANARPFDDVILEQVEYIAGISGLGTEQKHVNEVKMQVENARKYGTTEFDTSIPFPLKMPENYWKSMRDYKQLDVVAKLKLPIFIVQGERDYQVTMEDFGMWKTALKKNKKAAFKSYPKLNHLLHEGEGKATPDEYSEEKYIPGYVMEDIANWIKSNK
ncbi:alpha/beta fold hydrolase [Bacteroides sp. 519]|uniref:alpha/beta hydrolase n=1 Tax=Bacteroides sp. 519 TaxID=2302937 RepID=UPI0013D2720A|nr:alpha/beta fold hydrolase [Bacteroides sp. 519]NDV59018.1 alpha/beta fold hydrolase [Bacteroides sp. 519]